MATKKVAAIDKLKAAAAAHEAEVAAGAAKATGAATATAATKEAAKKAAKDKVVAAAGGAEKPAAKQSRGRKAAETGAKPAAKDAGTKIESDAPLSTASPEQRVIKSLEVPERVRVESFVFPRGRAVAAAQKAADGPVAPDPPQFYGPPSPGPIDGTQNVAKAGMSPDAAERLRRVMLSTKESVARESAAAAKSARRAEDYPERITELRRLRQNQRATGGPESVERVRRTNSKLIAELRRRTEQSRSGPAFQGPPVADLVADGKPRGRQPRSPASNDRTGMRLPEQYGVIRRLVRGAYNRAKPIAKAVPRLAEDAAIIGGIGGGLYGLGAAGGVRGVGSYIMNGRTPPPAKPAQQEQADSGQPRESYGSKFRSKMRNYRQTAAGGTGTFRQRGNE